MVELSHEDLSGSRFTDVDLSGARFHNVLLDDVVIRGAWGRSLSIDGAFEELLLEGIDVIPLWRAELVRRHPEYALLPPTDANGYRAAWPVLEGLWGETVDRARRLPEALLHERVDGEWSFIETLRHLVFATDAWVRRALLGDPSPYHPLDLAHDDMGDDIVGVPHDSTARPSLDEVLALRADRMATVAEVIGSLTDERLGQRTTPVEAPGYPESESFEVARCLRAVLNEEWWHRRYAERDLDVLEARSSAG